MQNSITIRKAVSADIDGIAALFNYRKAAEDLKWLLSDRANPGSLRGLVAVDPQDKIVGHCGYVASTYAYNKGEYAGINPMTWVVLPDYYGKGIGKKLMLGVMEMGDFAVLLGGSLKTLEIFPRINFMRKFDIGIFVKVIDLRRYIIGLEGNIVRRLAKTSYLVFRALKRSRSKERENSINIAPYKRDKAPQIALPDGIFSNLASSEHVEWILDCPLTENKAFIVNKGDRAIGIAVCCVSKDDIEGRMGRIVHLSYLGEDVSIWNEALSRLEEYFRSKGCVAISALSSSGVFMKSLAKSGWAVVGKNRLPFSLYDPKNSFRNIPDASWHFTFLEGDTGYRGI